MRTIKFAFIVFTLFFAAGMAVAFWTVPSYRANMHGADVPCGIFIHLLFAGCVLLLIVGYLENKPSVRKA
jgi:hypothetical protein